MELTGTFLKSYSNHTNGIERIVRVYTLTGDEKAITKYKDYILERGLEPKTDEQGRMLFYTAQERGNTIIISLEDKHPVILNRVLKLKFHITSFGSSFTLGIYLMYLQMAKNAGYTHVDWAEAEQEEKYINKPATLEFAIAQYQEYWLYLIEEEKGA